MTSVAAKADYVRGERAKGAGNHTCHWPGCTMPVPAAMWGCFTHWTRLPRSLQSKIWATYQPGQEISKTPSREYIDVALEVQEWIRKDILRERGLEYDL